MPEVAEDLLIQQIYVSYFNRPADPYGLAFWKSVLQLGIDIPVTSIANYFFGASQEFNSIYSGTSIEKVGLLYQNIFNRTADLDGLVYWANLLDTGQLSFPQIVNALVASAVGSDKEVFQARVNAAQRFTDSLDTQEEIWAFQGAAAAKVAKNWLASITDDASGQIAIGQLDNIIHEIVVAVNPPTPTPEPTPTPTPSPAPAPPPPPQYSFTAQAGATPATLSFINSNVSNQTFSSISGLSPLNSSDTLEISFNDGGNTLSASQTLNVGHLNLNSAGIVNLNTTNGVGSSGAATFSGITDAWLTSLSITSPSSGPLTLGTITPAPSSLINLNADNVSGFLTVAFASGSFNSGDIYSSPNIRGALGGGDYNLGNPSVATGIWLNGSTNIVRYASHTTEQQVYVRPGLTTNATIYGFGSASAQDYLKIDGGSTAVVVLDNDTHLNDVKIDVQGSGNLTITGLKGGDNIWVDAPASLHATATGAWTPTLNTVTDGSAFINANGYNIDLQNVNVISARGWTITNSGEAASLRGSSHADTIDYSSAVAVNNSIPWGITLTLLGSSPATVIPNNTNVSADTLQDIENVIGTNGMDFIYGDVNNNIINGGAGNDIIYGGAGVDTVDYSSALNSNGSSLTTSDTGITLGLNGITRVTLDPGSTNAGYDGISHVENVIGTNGRDTITGDSNDNTINGGAGDDTIDGADGSDTVDYSSVLKSDGFSLSPIDTGIHLTLGGFIDVTLNGAGSDAGADNISNVENVIGTNGRDTITGDSNDNTINGGGGADTINGGDGVDTFVYAAITDFIADNAIVDSIVGGNGTDTIRIDQTSAFTIANTDSFARASTIEALAVGAENTGDISITLNANAFTAGIRTVTLAGDTNSSGNNTINASSQGSGAISLTLTGSAGQDTIIGGNGADVITGGNGADILTGGIGPDIFAYTGNQSSNMAQTGNVVTGAIDVITDFTTSVDRIDLEVSGVGEFAGTGQANSNYADAYNHATSRFSAQGVYYIVEAYSSGSTWTSVLFARNNPDISSPNPTGAIQIGIVGAYSTSTAALAAILESDII